MSPASMPPTMPLQKAPTMPRRAARPCSVPGCPELIRGKGRFCAQHQAEEYARQDARRGSATRRGYGTKWRRIRARFLARYPTCKTCGAPATVAHHKVRRRDGGRDSFDNLMALCTSCHSRLHAESGESF